MTTIAPSLTSSVVLVGAPGAGCVAHGCLVVRRRGPGLPLALVDPFAVRRDLHAHPETAFEEHRTQGVVADALAAVDRHLDELFTT